METAVAYRKFRFVHFLFLQMEAIIEKMQGENGGVSVRTVKAFMRFAKQLNIQAFDTKTQMFRSFFLWKFRNWPSVFTGSDLISWILKNLEVEDVTDALHLAYLLSSHGYLFPIDDHALTVKNDGTFYRFVDVVKIPEK